MINTSQLWPAQGSVFFVSPGDGGSSPGAGGHDHSGPVQVESPANDPNVTAVGGTSLNLNVSTGAVSSESAWFDGGGGVSAIFARPAWQTGPGVPVGSNRLVPDAALVADLDTGGYLILNGQLFTVDGTSWSSPTWAGFCEMINQVRANLSKPSVGLLGPKIYPLIGTSNFRDITTGSNGPNGACNAGPVTISIRASGCRTLLRLSELLAPKIRRPRRPINLSPSHSSYPVALRGGR
jgi:kumamolisin